jgi:hypothetical protein
VIDVRANPYANNFYAVYNNDSLKINLRRRGISYHNYYREFGALQADKRFAFEVESGAPDRPYIIIRDYYYIDFEKFAESEAFQDGVTKLSRGMERKFIFGLMCSEKRPEVCHRALLSARAFLKKGYNVIHLLPEASPDGGQITQEDVESKLLERYYPDWELRDFCLPEEKKSRKEWIDLAYRRANNDGGNFVMEKVMRNSKKTGSDEYSDTLHNGIYEERSA